MKCAEADADRISSRSMVVCKETLVEGAQEGDIVGKVELCRKRGRGSNAAKVVRSGCDFVSRREGRVGLRS